MVMSESRRRSPMRKYTLAVTVAAVAVLSGVAIASPTNCDGCIVGVAENGALLGSRGVVSSARIGKGVYEVTFTKNIAGCAFYATQVFFTTAGDHAFITTEIFSDRPKVIRYYVVAINAPYGRYLIDANFTSTLTCI
jgi:hypothetical protein